MNDEQAVRAKISDVVATGRCENCGTAISQTYWRGGGWLWNHDLSGMPDCKRPSYAKPTASSIIGEENGHYRLASATTTTRGANNE